jgi:hypothetical protein
VKITGVVPREAVAANLDTSEVTVSDQGREVGPFPVLAQEETDQGVLFTVEVPDDHPLAKALQEHATESLSIGPGGIKPVLDDEHEIARRQREAIARKAPVPLPPPGSIEIPTLGKARREPKRVIANRADRRRMGRGK